MIYDQYFIDDLRIRADLVRIIEPYAPLRKKGANWMACCPFHQEKTPSFSVNPSKGLYKCFGCGKGGNVFTFLMEMEGLNFPEAIQRVAEISGVPLPEPVDERQYKQSKKQKEEKKLLADQIIELNQAALEFWEHQLQQETPKARAARDYLEKRGIPDEIQKRFHIGFSPDSWDALLNHLSSRTNDEKLIEESGLVSLSEDRSRVYDRFRGRIMFPVLDVNGNPVAFGARALGDEQPKYLNSPETAAYIKGEHLFGLFTSKEAIRQKKFVILVEGYLDLIALYQFGVTNVVASLGTALTTEQSRLVSRFTKKIVINYDGDSAGIKAARRAIEELLRHDLEIKVLVLPNGEDPDDFIRKNGPEEYNKARGRAVSWLGFTLESSLRGRSMTNPKQKAEAIEEVLPTITSVKNSIQKREYFDHAMAFFHIEDDAIRRELWNSVRKNQSMEQAAIEKQVRRSTRTKITVAERHLLELLVYDRELQQKVLPMLEETDYADLATAPIFRALFNMVESDVEFSTESVTQFVEIDEYLQEHLAMLVISEPKREPGEVIDNVLHHAENCIFTLRSMAISNRIHEISQQILASEQAGDTRNLEHLVLEQLDLTRMRHELLTKIREV